MTKDELIREVARQSNISEEEAQNVINIFVAKIKSELARGEKVSIPGFGSFVLSEHKAKTFINPKTGVKQEVPQRVVPRFKPGEVLKKLVGGR